MDSVRLFLLPVVAVVWLTSCSSTGPNSPDEISPLPPGVTPDKLAVVDCLLPGRLVQLGTSMTYLTASQPIRTTAQACEIRGGKYVAYDRSNFATALQVWQGAADQGDPAAQTYVGEIYEKGMGVPPDPARAATWYEKAAAKGYPRALTNLAYLYEKGLGVERDPQKAMNLSRRAVGMPETVALAQGPSSEELQQIRRQLESANRKLQETETALTRAQAAAAQKEELVKQLKDQLDQMQNDKSKDKQMQQLRDELNRSKQEADQFKKTAASAEEQARQYRETVAKLEAKITGPPPQVAAQSLNLGSYTAVVIGNQHYQNHPALKTAINDAKRVAEILEKKYGFKTKLLIDANYATMTKALYDAIGGVGERDNLLVYYAGHGQRRDDIARGYWLPVDAGKELDGMWVSTSQINDILALSKATHAMVIADSCYAGALVRGADEPPARPEPGDKNATTEWIQHLARAKSRNALTSGGLTPVVDSVGAASNSIFASALLDVLNNNGEVLSGYSLWVKLAPRVTAAADRINVHQAPEYNAMFGAGHDSGEFFFSPLARKTADVSRFAMQ